MGWEATQSVIERLVVRPVEGERGLVHVQWLAGAQGQRVVQMYVDGRLSEVAGDAQVRELWVMVDAARAQRVDVLAVPAAEAWKDHAELLAAEGETHVGWQPGVLRDLRLPVDTRMQVRAGEEVVHESRLFPEDQARSGWGGLMGLGTFGFDDATAPGLGDATSELGNGPLGFDGASWRFGFLPEVMGEEPVSVQGVDGQGEAVTSPWVLPAVVRHELARAGHKVQVTESGEMVWE